MMLPEYESPKLKPDKPLIMLIASYNNPQNTIIAVEFCDLVDNLNDDIELLHFVDYCYWHYPTSDTAKENIFAMQNILVGCGLSQYAQILGDLHIRYLAN